MKILAIFGLGRTAPLEAEIDSLKMQLQTTEVEKLIAEDRLRSAMDDKAQLWGLMDKSIQDMKIAYQMHINLQWQKQGLPAPYPEAPGMSPEQSATYGKPEKSTVPRPKMASELVREAKLAFIKNVFKGQEPDIVPD